MKVDRYRELADCNGCFSGMKDLMQCRFLFISGTILQSLLLPDVLFEVESYIKRERVSMSGFTELMEYFTT
jgi:hypothetical protein